MSISTSDALCVEETMPQHPDLWTPARVDQVFADRDAGYVPEDLPQIQQFLLETRIALAVYRKPRPLRLDEDSYALFSAFDIAEEAEVKAAIRSLTNAGVVDVVKTRSHLALAVPSPRPLRIHRRVRSDVWTAGPYGKDGKPIPETSEDLVCYGLYETGASAPLYEAEDGLATRRAFLKLTLLLAIARTGPLFIGPGTALFTFIEYVLRYRLATVYDEMKALAAAGLLEFQVCDERLAIAARPDISARIAEGIRAADRGPGIKPYAWIDISEPDGMLCLRGESRRDTLDIAPAGELAQLIEVAA
jgi:hypothetical protein